MEQLLLEHFQRLIAARTGLQIRHQEREALDKTLMARARVLQLFQPDQYYRLLETGGAQSESEWKQLIALLTNQESYFFRDKGQFALLREHILPELIQANQHCRTLRLWSAGCSTGEEPYSLAMLVDQLLPQWENWQVSILGTDIKEGALEKARQGLYSPWSFRLVEPHLQERYFRRQQTDYKLEARIRAMVTFRPGNLFTDDFPNVAAGFADMDLILCRNVFIYFEENAVSVVLDKFARTLRDGGYLMTGHAELSTQQVRQLQARVLPGSVVYQRGGAPVIASQIQAILPIDENSAPVLHPFQNTNQSTPVAATLPIAKAEVADGAPSSLQEAEILFGTRDYGAAAQKLESLLQIEPHNCAALCLAAQAAANLGRHETATRYCRQAIETNAFTPVPFHVLAHIAEEQGDHEVAKEYLKKVIYLEPAFISAYLDLSALHEKEGDLIRSKKMRTTALKLLQAMDSQTIVEPYGLVAQQMIRQLQGAPVADAR